MPLMSHWTLRRTINYIRKQTVGPRRRSEGAVGEAEPGRGERTCDIHVTCTCGDSAVRSGVAVASHGTPLYPLGRCNWYT